MGNCDLALEIVNRAVTDWRLLIQAKAWKCKRMYQTQGGFERLPSYRVNFKELRRFFKSEWCDNLLVSTDAAITAEKILAVLERELEEAMEEDAKREARKREQRTM